MRRKKKWIEYVENSIGEKKRHNESTEFTTLSILSSLVNKCTVIPWFTMVGRMVCRQNVRISGNWDKIKKISIENEIL